MSLFDKLNQKKTAFSAGAGPHFHAGRTAAVIAGAAAVLILGMDSFYNVSEQEQAVVTMFGQVQSVKSAGLYFKIPYIQRAHKINTTTFGVPIGYTVGDEQEQNGDNPESSTVNSESTMITRDFNFVNIDFYLEYRVSDPVKYLYAATDPESILKNEALASIRSTVVNYSVDDVITTGKSQIQAEVKEKLMEALAESDIGIQVVNISVQDAEPPTAEVLQAFKAVETSKQGAETAINNAKQYQSERTPAAEANADKIRQNAEGKKAARIAEAEGQAARFSQTYAEYSKYPLITKQRMFYETIEDVLPGLKVIITDGTTKTLLPLDSFTQAVQSQDSAQSDSADKSAAAGNSTDNSTAGNSADESAAADNAAEG